MEGRLCFVEDGLKYRGDPAERVPDDDIPIDISGLSLGRDWNIADRWLFWLRLRRLGKALAAKKRPPPGGVWKLFVRYWEMKHGTWRGVAPWLTDGTFEYPFSALRPLPELNPDEVRAALVAGGARGLDLLSSRERMRLERASRGRGRRRAR
jgi:hypothetical protein